MRAGPGQFGYIFFHFFLLIVRGRLKPDRQQLLNHGWKHRAPWQNKKEEKTVRKEEDLRTSAPMIYDSLNSYKS